MAPTVLIGLDGATFTVHRVDINSGATTPVLSLKDFGIRKVTNAAAGPKCSSTQPASAGPTKTPSWV